MKPILSRRATPKSRSTASFPAHIADELRRYDEHLRNVRGLATGTRKDRLYIPGKLLRQKFKGGAIDISRLRPDDVANSLPANWKRAGRPQPHYGDASGVTSFFWTGITSLPENEGAHHASTEISQQNEARL